MTTENDAAPRRENEGPEKQTVKSIVTGQGTPPVRLGSYISPAVRAGMFAQLGWRVFPVVPKTKVPAINDWPNKATTDFDIIDEWFNWTRAAHEVGIATGYESGIWVLDIDVHWTNGFKSAHDLFVKHGVTEVPETFRVKTKSGGQHWYFRYPEVGVVRNITSSQGRPGRLGAGLDVRGRNGYVVAPLGVGREIINDTPPIHAPAWLVKIVTTEPKPAKLISVVTTSERALQMLLHMASKLAQTSTSRNATLNSFAFQLGHLGARGLLRMEDAYAALFEACRQNDAIADWRNGEAQFEATFQSGWNAGMTGGV